MNSGIVIAESSNNQPTHPVLIPFNLIRHDDDDDDDDDNDDNRSCRL
jgi:hypothetical protein